MPKGVPNKSYTGEFKQMVVETMCREGLSYREAARQFSLPNNRAASWERIYLEEGPEGLYIERRVLRGKPKLDKQIEEDLIAMLLSSVCLGKSCIFLRFLISTVRTSSAIPFQTAQFYLW